MKGYDPYWVLPLDGDPLGAIGSGFRQVWVKSDPLRRVVYLKAPGIEGRQTLKETQWADVAHIPNTGQSLDSAITALRRYYLTNKGD